MFSCFGLASAARVPVKRYNRMVADLYPMREPDGDGELDPAVLRRIGKLGEYLDRNEHRIPKVEHGYHGWGCMEPA